MELISGNKHLVRALSRLIRNYTDIRFAVAWATSGHSVFELLQEHSVRISRAIIGTHFYQTHPDVLDAFHRHKTVRFVLQTDGVFHPKLYLFQNKDYWEALVGSANLTNGALGSNSEAMLLVGGPKNGSGNLSGDIVRLIDSYWGFAKSVKRHEVQAYREVWKQKRTALDRLKGHYGSSKVSRSPTESSVMSMGWREYFEAVKVNRPGLRGGCLV